MALTFVVAAMSQQVLKTNAIDHNSQLPKCKKRQLLGLLDRRGKCRVGAGNISKHTLRGRNWFFPRKVLQRKLQEGHRPTKTRRWRQATQSAVCVGVMLVLCWVRAASVPFLENNAFALKVRLRCVCVNSLKWVQKSATWVFAYKSG